MNYSEGLTPVKHRATIDYGAQGGGPVDHLTLDVVGWSRNQVIELLRFTAAQEVAAQMRLDNPPQIVISDGTRGKPITSAVRRIEVGFGQTINPAALSALKGILQKAIARTTGRRTGALSSMSNWEYVLIKNGKAGPVPMGNRAGIPLGADDAIVLRPTNVPHATVANIGGKRSRDARSAARRTAKGKAPGKGRAKGFMGQASAAARRSPAFAGFNVAVRFTDYAVAGEKWKTYGRLTATIMITLAKGKRRGRRR